MIPSNFSPLKISSKIFLRIYNNFSTYIYISPYFRLPYDPFTSLPSLRFLNIDRISLTNIRLARSGGDFLAKSRYTHIDIYVHIWYTLSFTCGGKSDEEIGGDVRAWIMQRSARKCGGCISPKRNRIFPGWAAILLSVIADTRGAGVHKLGIARLLGRLLARRDRQMAFKLIPPNFQPSSLLLTPG